MQSENSKGLEPIVVSEAEKELALTVREFARSRPFPPTAKSPTRGGFDREFSKDLAKLGWAGMLVPERFGGSERTGVERCLVISELLAAGAPLGAHWTADRQTAPSLDHYGPEAMRQLLLPKIARGECLMAGGLSEPDSGSDLASVKTRATKVDGGWKITGRKIWTSDADQADYIEVLCRTSTGERKHDGLSLIVVPMDAPGIDVRPIRAMDGENHFCEVAFTEVFAGDDWLIGEEGQGWRQITSELALERSGPERYLTTFPLFKAFVESRANEPESPEAFRLIGRVIAEQISLRQMSLAIARMVDRKESPVAEAAMAKDLGTTLEQHLVDELWPYRYESNRRFSPGDAFAKFLDINRLRSAVFTTAGGTNEVLRILVARELNDWSGRRRAWVNRGGGAASTTGDVIEAARPEGDDAGAGEVDLWSSEATAALHSAGFLGVSVPEALGGAGGTLVDACDIVRASAYAAVSTPVVEGPILAGWLLSKAGINFPWSEKLVVHAPLADTDAVTIEDDTASGHIDCIRWAPVADEIALALTTATGIRVITVSTSALTFDNSANTAAEPVAIGVTFEAAPVVRSAEIVGDPEQILSELRNRGALGKAVALAGTLQRAAEIAITYTRQREQFGRPIASFQAVQTHLASIASEAQRVAILTDWAVAQIGTNESVGFTAAAAAKTLAGNAAITAARAAHQVHGAMGITMEYPLQRSTRRLWEWAAQDGSTEAWAEAIGREACSSPGAAWRLVTSI